MTVHPLGPAVRVADAQFPEAAFQPVQVGVEQERLPGKNRDDFVDGIAEEEGAVEWRNPHVGERHEVAVEPGGWQRRGHGSA